MKTKKEILSEIKSIELDIKRYRLEKRNGEISNEFWKFKYQGLSTTLNTLKWVLGDSCRYD